MRSRRMLFSVLIRRTFRSPTPPRRNSHKERHYAMCQDFGLRQRFLFGGAH